MKSGPDPSRADLEAATKAAVNRLRHRDRDILGTTEHVLVGRLMIYLNDQFKQWDDTKLVLDQDYERAGRDVKRVVSTTGLARKIVPDIVHHRRGSHDPEGNLLAIEVKVTNGNAGFLHDRAKLAVLTGLAPSAMAYPKALRLPGDPAPAASAKHHPRTRPSPEQQLPRLTRPADPLTSEVIHLYRFGLWLLVTQQTAQMIWFDAPIGDRVPAREDAIEI